MARPLRTFLPSAVRATGLTSLLAVIPSCDSGSGLVVLDLHGRPLVPDLERPGEAAARAGFHDFGRVPLGESAEHTFFLVNSDPLPVRIERVNPSCGCSDVRLTVRQPDGRTEDGVPTRVGDVATVEPGGRLALAVRIDSREVLVKNTDKLVRVDLLTSSSKRPYVVFEYHLIVDAELQIVPAAIDLGRVARDVGGRGRTEIAAVGPSGTRPVGLAELPADVRAVLREETRALGTVWVVEAELLPPLPVGRSERVLTLLTERPAGPGASAAAVSGRSFPIALTALGVDDVELLPQQVIVSVRSGESAAAEAVLRTNLSGHAFGVSGYELDENARGWVTLTFEPAEPASGGKCSSWTVKVEARPPPGQPAVAGAGAVLLDDPQVPRVEFRYAVRVL